MPETQAASAHPSAVAHHFDTLEQQNAAANLGVWAFLVTEVMMFGALFTAFAVYRTYHEAAFSEASRLLDVPLGTLNTAVLIGSSFTVALAVRSAQIGKQRGIVGFFALTVLLGLVFLTVKCFEYGHKLEHHLFPGNGFIYGGDNASQVELFFCFYFFMTGLHALHMVVGICVIGWFAWAAHRGRYTAQNHNAVEGVGLYWHFVDIVWIFLFPLLYLIGHHE